MDAASSWAGLDASLVCRIIKFLPCLAHRAMFAAVCRDWLRVSRKIPNGPQIPWLLLPSSALAAQDPCFFCLLCRTTHRAAFPDDVLAARCCGSYDKCLILALHQTGGYAIYRLDVGWGLYLPQVLRTPGPVNGHRMVIHAALTRFSVSDEDNKVLYVAAIGAWSASTIAFWRISKDCFGKEPHPGDSCGEVLPRGRSIADAVYYSGHGLDGFHVLTDDQELLVYVPGTAPDGVLTMRMVAYCFPTHKVTPRAITRYLVEYADELLMVARIVMPDGWTRAFHVFKLVPEQPPEQGSDRPASWVPMHVIPSGIIVHGRCCSRSFPTYGIDFDGVYFLDDATSSQDAATRALEPAATRQYPCWDMGWLPLLEHKIKRIFPKRLPSESSRAVWFFP